MEQSVMKKNKKRKFLVSFRKAIPVYIMMLPGLIYLFCNNYMPMFGILIAFKKMNWKKGILGSEWVGFDNFQFLFRSRDLGVMLRNTVLYNVLFIVLGMVCAITVAILLNEIRCKLAKSVYQSVILLPYLMSMVVVSYLVYAFLANETGYFNKTLLPALGVSPVNWYQDPKVWPVILTVVNLWKSIGFNMIIYYSSIVGIDSEYFEAARLDGATKWQQIRCITLPLLKSTVIVMLIMSVGHIFASDFGLFYQIPRNQGALYSATMTIDTYVYNSLMGLGNISMSSAASVFQSIVGMVLVVITNAIVRKYEKESAIF